MTIICIFATCLIRFSCILLKYSKICTFLFGQTFPTFSLFMLSLFFKARADTLHGEAKQWKFFGMSLRLLRPKWQIFKMTLPQKNGHGIKTPSSKLMILVSSCWKKNCIQNNAHNLFILSLIFLKPFFKTSLVYMSLIFVFCVTYYHFQRHMLTMFPV